MRMILKLVALAVLGLVFQTAFEVTSAVTALSSDDVQREYGDAEQHAVSVANQKFETSSPFSRWVVKDVLAMPYEYLPSL